VVELSGTADVFEQLPLLAHVVSYRSAIVIALPRMSRPIPTESSMSPLILDHDTSCARPSALEAIGFELGWDYAHHGLQPPAPYGAESSALLHGLRAGRATFGLRTLAATRHVQRWLALRLHAWLSGQSVELFQLTPNYLAQLEVAHCPVTRVLLTADSADGSRLCLERVRHDAAYAAGNIVVMSRSARHAKGVHGYASAQQLALPAETAGESGRTFARNGLSRAEWARMATLCSFVQALTHETAVALPMHLLPPNRLRLFNPAQGLQALLSQQLLQPGWSRRFRRFEAELLPCQATQRDFRAFVTAMLPRALEAGPSAAPWAARWAVEDAWSNALVQKRWQAFAGPLGAAACEALVRKAHAAGLATSRVEVLSDASATDGWNLTGRGHVAEAAEAPARRSQPARQLSLALVPG
jgi:hypothetical protein